MPSENISDYKLGDLSENNDKIVSLSFDFEEFDVPLENGKDIDMSEQMRISHVGAEKILDILKTHNVRATFFCTLQFAKNAPDIIGRIIQEGHELASHGCYHSSFAVSHLAESKEGLEKICGQRVYGYRTPRMARLDEMEVAKAGYEYNSSLNPTFIPGRYNNFRKPAVKFTQHGIIQIPASVSPVFRLPMFWLGLHNYPMWLYLLLAKWTLERRRTLVIYMHPWEFYDLNEIKEKYSLSWLMTHNCGEQLAKRLNTLIERLKKENAQFITMHEWAIHK